jgi:hypothetical protein
MLEVCLVPTFKRPELLCQCLSRIRQADVNITIRLFPDHNTWKDAAFFGETFGADVHHVPEHNYYGNSYNTMEAYRWAYNAGFHLTYLIEDDVFVHPDFFFWHRKMHEEFPDIFAAMAWIFNRNAPIDDGEMFQPWYYSIGTSFSREKLGLIVEHASPLYYGDMGSYIRERFSSNPLNDPFNIMHTEQDGLIQRILDKDKSQTVSPGIAKCSHMGFGGYNRGWSAYERFFEGCASFTDRVHRLDALFEDPYWRISLFGREIVEREIGQELPTRSLNYRIKLPGGWESEFTSEMSREHLPSRINSVPVPADAQFVLLS